VDIVCVSIRGHLRPDGPGETLNVIGIYRFEFFRKQAVDPIQFSRGNTYWRSRISTGERRRDDRRYSIL
jgi:hypothetical protein